MSSLTQARLKQLFHYDRLTGVWTRLEDNELLRRNITTGVTLGVDGRRYQKKRLAFLYVNGEMPTRTVVHKNGDSKDFRFKNLQTSRKQPKLKQADLKDVLIYNPYSGTFRSLDKYRCTVFVSSKGRLHVIIDDSLYKASRLAFLYMTGEEPEIVSHSHGDVSDIRWMNLRGMTRAAWQKRQNKSGVIGVHQQRKTGYWVSSIYRNGKQQTLYTGKSFREACLRRKAAEEVNRK